MRVCLFYAEWQIRKDRFWSNGWLCGFCRCNARNQTFYVRWSTIKSFICQKPICQKINSNNGDHPFPTRTQESFHQESTESMIWLAITMLGLLKKKNSVPVVWTVVALIKMWKQSWHWQPNVLFPCHRKLQLCSYEVTLLFLDLACKHNRRLATVCCFELLKQNHSVLELKLKKKIAHSRLVDCHSNLFIFQSNCTGLDRLGI